MSFKYRKKPVVIEAWQIPPDDDGTRATPIWVIDGLIAGQLTAHEGGGLTIQTLEGPMHGSIGDYLIRGIKGELYACKPDIFAATYEAVE